MSLTEHQRNQIKIVDDVERQIKSNTVSLSSVAPTEDFESDPRLCLTSVHFPSRQLKAQVIEQLIEPLRSSAPQLYYYGEQSLHITVKSVRVISSPPMFSPNDIKLARSIFGSIVPGHSAYRSFLYRLLLFPTSISLIGSSDPELDDLILDLDDGLKTAGLPDDKHYANSKYFYTNMTLARFATAPGNLASVVEKLKFDLDPYVIDSVSLITSNAALKRLTIYGQWQLNRVNE